MKLERVTIKNFRNVESKELELSIKNIISGKNMSGKTNTLNAIHWAFTGTTMDGSSDNRANITYLKKVYSAPVISVELDFEDFTFTRICEVVEGTPTVRILINGEQSKTIKIGEAILHAKLGLSDIILNQPRDFSIIRFLLNPLYFETISPSAMRKFLYMLANVNFRGIAEEQTKGVLDTIHFYGDIYDPYKLGDIVAKEKKTLKKLIEGCKLARELFPSILEESLMKESETAKEYKLAESREALISKYALRVSKEVNNYYKSVMGIKVCLLEPGVGEDVFKDVCYPILPKSGLPFDQGSQAERTFVGMKFINEFCLTFNIKPLPILVDNMESLDGNTEKFVDSLGVQYIGALVK